MNDNEQKLLFKDIYPWSTIDNKPRYMVTTKKLMDMEFIHLSKTGGESVESTLSLNKSHSKANDRIDRIVIKPNRASFTVIRNPYSRTFSWFKFCIHGWHKLNNIPSTRFSESKWCCQCQYARNIWTEKYKYNKTQYSIENAKKAFELWLIKTFLTSNNSYCMEVNLPWNLYLIDHKTNQFLVDIILKYEYYQQDWNIFLNIFNLNHEKFQLKHQNVDKSDNNLKRISMTKLIEKEWKYYYTQKSKKIVADRFRLDFKIFNYQYDF